MGDMLMVLPAMQEIQSRHPEATIDLLTSIDGKRIIPCTNLNIADIHVYGLRSALRFLEKIAVKNFIHRRHYDAIYVFEMKPRYCAWFKGFPCKQIHFRQSNKMHEAEAALDNVGLNNDAIKDWSAKKLLEPEVEMKQVVQEDLAQHGITDETYLVAIHPSYSGVHKQRDDRDHKIWPIEYWAQLAKLIQQEAESSGKDIRVICDLLPSEKSIADETRQACGDSVLVLKNAPNFKRYIALIDRVNCLVAPNTGSMHLAAALNTPVVALFSGESSEVTGPFSTPALKSILTAEDYTKGAGLARIQPQAVIQQVLSFGAP
jgi:ADP-heptose:LPS heptosyltransferase